jgi:hypothetical protein
MTFYTHYDYYEYIVMLFSLTNALVLGLNWAGLI